MSEPQATIELVSEASEELVVAFSRLLPQLSNAEPPDLTTLAEIAGRQGNHLLIARDGSGAIIGTLTLAVLVLATGRSGHIEDVVVDQSARGAGTGSALVERAIEIAAGLGCHSLELTSRPSRVEANQLYQRLGFLPRETNVYRLSLSEKRSR